MLVVSLTSIPPRFDRLPDVLDSIAAQVPKPDRVELNIPKAWRRFHARPLPALPDGVRVNRVDRDAGPILKLLPALKNLKGTQAQILMCDDDSIYGPGWVAAMLHAAWDNPGCAITGAGYGLERLGLRTGPRPGTVTIAQGYSGILLRPDMLDDRVFTPPDCAWGVDDVWISAMLAVSRVQIIEAPIARRCVQPFDAQGALQSATIDGLTRATANAATAAHVQQRFGIWQDDGAKG